MPLRTQLFDDNQHSKQQTNFIKTEPVKKCQRALTFTNNSELSAQRNLFNTKPNQKELSKLHKQV